jgi:ABC-type antimicrobial peptide transport system permease subunit
MSCNLVDLLRDAPWSVLAAGQLVIIIMLIRLLRGRGDRRR